MRNVYCVSSRVFKLRKIAFSGLIEGFTSSSRMFQNKIMTKYSAVVVFLFFSMSQQTRSREKSCLARRTNSRQTERLGISQSLEPFPTTLNLCDLLLVGEHFHTDLPRNHSKSYAGSQTHPNESQMLQHSMECERLTGRGVQ